MPIYEYRCGACGHQFEVLQRVGAGADGLSCETCGSERLDKQLSTFAATSGGATSATVSGCGPSGCGGSGGSGFT